MPLLPPKPIPGADGNSLFAIDRGEWGGSDRAKNPTSNHITSPLTVPGEVTIISNGASKSRSFEGGREGQKEWGGCREEDMRTRFGDRRVEQQEST